MDMDVHNTGSKPKRTFLKRGEGVQKRVFGPVIHKQRKAEIGEEEATAPRSARDTRSFEDQERVQAPQRKATVQLAEPKRTSSYITSQQRDRSNDYAEGGELDADTTLLATRGHGVCMLPPMQPWSVSMSVGAQEPSLLSHAGAGAMRPSSKPAAAAGGTSWGWGSSQVTCGPSACSVP